MCAESMQAVEDEAGVGLAAGAVEGRASWRLLEMGVLAPVGEREVEQPRAILGGEDAAGPLVEEDCG